MIFQAVQINSGQWRVFNTETLQYHGEAFRYRHEAERRARHLERMYA